MSEQLKAPLQETLNLSTFPRSPGSFEALDLEEVEKLFNFRDGEINRLYAKKDCPQTLLDRTLSLPQIQEQAYYQDYPTEPPSFFSDNELIVLAGYLQEKGRKGITISKGQLANSLVAQAKDKPSFELLLSPELYQGFSSRVQEEMIKPSLERDIESFVPFDRNEVCQVLGITSEELDSFYQAEDFNPLLRAGVLSPSYRGEKTQTESHPLETFSDDEVFILAVWLKSKRNHDIQFRDTKEFNQIIVDALQSATVIENKPTYNRSRTTLLLTPGLYHDIIGMLGDEEFNFETLDEILEWEPEKFPYFPPGFSSRGSRGILLRELERKGSLNGEEVMDLASKYNMRFGFGVHVIDVWDAFKNLGMVKLEFKGPGGYTVHSVKNS
jgi:hypothetical protein